MTTAEKIEYILKVNYWTQQQLADKIGVKQTTISAWKFGRVVRDSYVPQIDLLYNQARRLEWERRQPKLKPTPKQKEAGKVLSERGKMVLKFPWYSYQRKQKSQQVLTPCE
ncbi:helix-turn-helix domain-containing protein [Streptococcus sp. zg-86]|uniref:Helix-turn-helix domain-containing protein n=1 Tax=Streptococcus zhangguiae TaxID=2664091 RepID=A0A6I4RF13_9STRE|nr:MULTISPECIES: helix-turn-helix transcriptional regulator [unclassified Streptococcus]MTB64096.1 helix-turn-helix domain-containing protein [Streptococcus sp. zg-86]MTB90578.1 helix-turn-helix domain-containing protein [Streptococcus sp. zg-36]MWV56084.1 helix-turn-helix domain-containing protein [Streptococcus sp. zg-70]QTH48287.1 helix-turn-helix transcriptional regulator [Streptococcus sp. zg-86]